ncbi:BPSL0761 family protein [Trinickia mobilis]|uniref:BPSL0761 family protein n=1 Tax=Trinickia mobilis TaxID=2816356 RepID=UPI001A8E4D70|nr:BPSL0761 family protein [Trinickia mobilis]
MTMPDERTRAMLTARQLLFDLSQMTTIQDVNALRQRANAVLRHYPDDGMIALIANRSLWLEWSR